MDPPADRHRIRVGVQGWKLPADLDARFPGEGPALARYATRFDFVEINSTWYRYPTPESVAAWAAAVPPGFTFGVKAPRGVSHYTRLREPERLAPFLPLVGGLGAALGPLLIQTPANVGFDAPVAARFFEWLRERCEGAVVFEPRHVTWFEPAADELLAAMRIARVGADPALVPIAAEPGGHRGLAYFRMHGSPRMYWSSYGTIRLRRLAERLSAASERGPAYCVFDNTATPACFENALRLQRVLARAR